MITHIIVNSIDGDVFNVSDAPEAFGVLWIEAYPDDIVMLLIPECVFCGLDLCPAEKTVDADWMHVNGWYACDMAKMFAGIKIVQPSDLSVVATLKEE